MFFNLILLYQYEYQQPWYEEWLYYLMNFGITPILLIVLLFILFKRTKKEYHSHWNTLIDNFEYSSKDFYTELKKELFNLNIKGISTSFISLKEGGVTSPYRLYLQVDWRVYRYYICAAPFGSGFFLSWWLLYKIPIGKILIYKIPFIGGWLTRKLYPLTFYKLDTATMFQTYCHQSVLTVLDRITNEKGIRALSEEQRKPILKDVFKR